jgi:predicted Zn-dependent protease
MKQLALQALDSALRSGVSYADGCWGFAATDDLSKSGVESAAVLAVAIARSSGLAKKQDVAPARVFQNTVEQ